MWSITAAWYCKPKLRSLSRHTCGVPTNGRTAFSDSGVRIMWRVSHDGTPSEGQLRQLLSIIWIGWIIWRVSHYGTPSEGQLGQLLSFIWIGFRIIWRVLHHGTHSEGQLELQDSPQAYVCAHIYTGHVQFTKCGWPGFQLLIAEWHETNSDFPVPMYCWLMKNNW